MDHPSLTTRTAPGVPGIENYNRGVKYDRFTVFLNGTPDTIPPSAPDWLTANAVGSRQVNLLWQSSHDNVGVSSYKIYRDGSLLTAVTVTDYEDGTVVPDTTYTYTVSAIDTSGNESSQSHPAIVTIPPVRLTGITITPSNPSIPVGGIQPFKATGTYSDNATRDITASITWSSSDPIVASISNRPGSEGQATGAFAGTTTITAADPAGGIGGSTLLTVKAQSTTPLSDTFDRANSSSLGSAWNEYLPNLEIFSNQLRTTDAGNKAAIWSQVTGPDQDVSVDCYMTAAGNSCGVMARWANANNFYRARIDAGAKNITLFKTVNGTTTQLGTASKPIAFNTYYRVRLVVKGTALQVFFANESAPAISATDGSLTTGRFVGIRASSNAAATNWFDNFIAASDGASANQPPTARMSAAPSSGAAPLTVRFDGSASSDSDGTITCHSWNLGDGTAFPQVCTLPQAFEHTYTAPGTYLASLNVTDDRGATRSVQTTITVTSSEGGAVLFEDDFKRTTGLGSNWKVYVGSVVTDGESAVGQGAQNWAAISSALGTDDYAVESLLTVPAGSLYSGIVARGNPATSFYNDLYAAQISTKGSVNLYRRNAGTWTLLKSVAASISADQAYSLKLNVFGSNPVVLEVSLNGIVLFSHSDSSASRILSGIPGIQNYNAGVKYDRFRVTSP